MSADSLVPRSRSGPAAAGLLVLQHLGPFGPPPARLEGIIAAAAVRLLDTHMIVSDPAYAHSVAAWPLGRSVLNPELLDDFSDVEELTLRAGLQNSFRRLGLALSKSALTLLRPEQYESFGLSGSDVAVRLPFLLTDAGGTSVHQWRTQVDEGSGTMAVHKRWAMTGGTLRNGCLVVARDAGHIAPRAFLVKPSSSASLNIVEAGRPLFGGVVQLYHVDGTVNLSEVEPVASSRVASACLLAMLRPQVIRCAMSHLEWLRDHGRIALGKSDEAALGWLRDAARDALSEHHGSALINLALALKFAANEFILSLVVDGAFAEETDARDALALTKMEGSSYRCVAELAAKSELRRGVAS